VSLGDINYHRGLSARAKAEYDTALRIDPGDKNWANPAWREEAQPPVSSQIRRR
jgi:hypothetical protein